MKIYIRLALALAVGSLTACAAPSAPSSVPASPAATSPPTATLPASTSATGPETRATAGPVQVMPMALAGTLSFQGKPAGARALVFYDAISGAAVPMTVGEPKPVADATLAVTMRAPRSDAQGQFRFWVANLAPGHVLRVVAPGEDGKTALQALVVGPAARAVQQAGEPLAIDEVTTLLAQLQRGPLAALALVGPDALAGLVTKLQQDLAPLADKVREAIKRDPSVANVAIRGDGKPEAGREEMDAVMDAVKAAAIDADVSAVVANAVLAIQQGLVPGDRKEALVDRPMLGTALTMGLGSSGSLMLTNTATGARIDAKAADASTIAAAAVARSSSGGGSGGGGSVVTTPPAGTFTVTEGQALTLRFKGMVGDQPLVTSAADGAATDAPTFAGVGSDAQAVRPYDFRFYVHDVKLVKADATTVPLTLAANGWQYQNLALIDLDAGTTPEQNAVVTGTAPAGTYTGVRFTLGVPSPLNHTDLTFGAAAGQAPHAILAGDGVATGMGWSWMTGRKYAKIELGVKQAMGAEKVVYFHLGGTGATNPTKQDGTYVGFDHTQTTLAQPNLAVITLDAFDPGANVVVADLKAFLANFVAAGGGSYMPTRMTMDMGDMAEDPNDPKVFLKNLGLEGGTQVLFKKGS